jgi:hypothetical protein
MEWFASTPKDAGKGFGKFRPMWWIIIDRRLFRQYEDLHCTEHDLAFVFLHDYRI